MEIIAVCFEIKERKYNLWANVQFFNVHKSRRRLSLLANWT